MFTRILVRLPHLLLLNRAQTGGSTAVGIRGSQFTITLQPHNNSGFDPEGNLKPAYAGRLRRVIAEADRLGMVVIVGFFYFGSNERIQITPDDRYVKEAIVQGCRFLKGLPHRNILIEINNETLSLIHISEPTR